MLSSFASPNGGEKMEKFFFWSYAVDLVAAGFQLVDTAIGCAESTIGFLVSLSSPSYVSN